jgi:hypothetical protein
VLTIKGDAMKHRPIVLLLPLLLLGCGSPTPAPMKEAGPAVTAPAPGTGGEAPEQPAVTGAMPTPGNVGGPGPVAMPDLNNSRRPHADAGLPVKAYLEMLASPNSADVIDGLTALRSYPQRALKCMPKITELAKSKDPQIAALAAETIKAANAAK